MTLVCSINGTPLPDSAVLRDHITGFPSSAWYGEPMTAGVVIDDPEGAYNLQGWSVFTVDETDCTDHERIFTGWITGKKISRGPYKSGDSRQWDCDIIDQNACLSFMIFRANSAKRPAETDLERITFLLESYPMAFTPVVAGTLTNLTDDPRNLQEADHTRQYPVEAFTSTAGRSGKYFYVFWNDDTERLELFYDRPTAFPDSGLQISNVIADVDNDVIWYPWIDASLSRSPENLYTGELIDRVGGAEFVERQATIDALSPTPLSPDEWRREFHRVSDQISRASTAVSLGNADLEAFATEEDTITVTLRLPSTHVNLVKAGQTIAAKFTHLPGYELGPDVRVIRRNVVPAPLDQDAGPQYDVTLELSNKVKIRDVDGGPPGVFPKNCNPRLLQTAEAFGGNGSIINGTIPITLPSVPTPGNLLILWLLTRDTTDTLVPTGFTGIGSYPGVDWQDDPSTSPKAIGCRFWYRFVDVGDSSTLAFTGTGNHVTYGHVSEWSGVDTFEGLTTLLDDTDQGGGSAVFIAEAMVPIPGRTWLNVTGFMPSLNVNDDWIPSTSPGSVLLASSGVGTGTSTDAKSVVAARAGAIPYAGVSLAAAATISGISRGHAALTLFFSGELCEDECPAAGQWVRPPQFVAAGDGTTTNFFTNCPYADGTLRVFVDNLAVIAGLTEIDGATGEFQLDFAPKDVEGDAPAEVVTAEYQGR